MDRYILTCKGGKPIRHEGFELFNNPGGGHPHAWMRCAHGHAELLGRGKGSCLILEDDVLLVADFEKRLTCVTGMLGDPGVANLYVAVDIGIPMRFPVSYPPDVEDWGTQCCYYSPKARAMALKIIEAYLLSPVATRVNDYRTPENLRTPASLDGVADGFDVCMFKALRAMNVPVLMYPGVQHIGGPSTCLSNPHWSPFFAPPGSLCKGVDGWH